MHTTFSRELAHSLLCLVETVDAALTTYGARTMVPASEVVDTLLDIRARWLDAVMSEACDHHA